MRNLTAGHGHQGKEIDRHPVELFIQKHLKDQLMHMQPSEGMLQDLEKTWMLSNKEQTLFLIYSLKEQEIKWIKNPARTDFKGTWFHPGSGETKAAKLPKRIKKGTAIKKPSEEKWLLLLEAQD